MSYKRACTAHVPLALIFECRQLGHFRITSQTNTYHIDSMKMFIEQWATSCQNCQRLSMKYTHNKNDNK